MAVWYFFCRFLVWFLALACDESKQCWSSAAWKLICRSKQCSALLYSYKLKNSLFHWKDSRSHPKKGDAVIASFFNENGISFNVANSSSFGRMIAENVEFAKQKPLQIYKTSSRMRRSFSCEVTQRLCVTFSMCMTRCMEQAKGIS